MKNGLGNYFIQFGGAGGANAGIANAASHGLRKLGELFGKHFSRGTHNALKHALSKIGATSMKAVGVAVAVIVEVGILVWEYSTWKGGLKDKIDKALKAWQNENEPLILKDIEQLRLENISTIQAIAKDVYNSFEIEQPSNIAKCEEDARMSIDIAKRIGIVK